MGREWAEPNDGQSRPASGRRSKTRGLRNTAAGRSRTLSRARDRRRLLIETLECRYLLAGNEPPSVASILRMDPNPTAASTVTYEVRFSEAVTGVDLSDLSLLTTGLTGAGITELSGSDSVYIVKINSGEGVGELSLRVEDDDTIIDSSNKPLGGPGVDNGGSTTSEPYTIAPAAITGRVWSDLDSDGIHDPGESGMPDVVVFADENHNGVRDDGEPMATTRADDPATTDADETGFYEISNLGAADLDVTVELTGNLRQSFPLAASTADGRMTLWESLPPPTESSGSYPHDVVVSPSGNLAVVTWHTWQGRAITTYARNPDDGRLSLLAEITGDTLYGASYSVFAPDGNHLYVPAQNDNAINVFSVDSSGTLTFVQAVSSTSLGINALDRVRYLAISPDGEHLFASSSNSKALTVFAIDSATGQLTLTQIFQDGVDGVEALDFPHQPAVTPDGTLVLVPSQSSNQLSFFDRDPSTGTLTVGQAPMSLGSLYDVKVSGDGRFIYVADGRGSIHTLERDPSTAIVSSVGSFSTGIASPERMTLSPDGTSLYFTASDTDEIVTLRRDGETGLLSLEQVLQKNVDLPDFEDPRGLAVSPDGANLYVVASRSYRLHAFAINQGVRRPVPQRVSTALGETESDIHFGVTIDAPEILEISALQSSPASAPSIDFKLSFSEPVTGVDATDFELFETTLAGASISTITGGPREYTVTVDTPTGVGSVRLQLVDDDTILDADMVPLSGDGIGAILARSESVWVDSVGPRVLAIVPQPVILAGATSVDFYVAFDEPVSGLDSADFTLSQTGETVGSITSVVGTGDSFIVAVGLSGGDGTVTLGIVDDDSIHDAAGNALGGRGTSGSEDGSFVGSAHQVAPPSVGGSIWIDADRDGVRDPGERGHADLIVYADLNLNGARDADEPFSTTSSDDPGTTRIDEEGQYTILGLTADTTYSIAVELSSAWQQTAPVSYPDSDGTLTFKDAFTAGTHPDTSLYYANSVTVGPGGNHVYATGNYGHSMAVFARDSETDTFRRVGQVRSSTPGFAGLSYPNDFAMTPDGRFGFLTSRGSDTVYAVSRDLDTGSLSFLAKYQHAVDGLVGLDGAYNVEVHPDGRWLYVTSQDSDSLLVFAIDPDNGSLELSQMFRDGVEGIESLDGAADVQVTPDGRQVIVSAVGDAKLTIFDVHPGTGRLAPRQVFNGAYSVYSMAVAPDGRFLYTAEKYWDAVDIYARDVRTGAWTFKASVDLSTGHAASVSVSPDGNSLYVADSSTDAIKVYDRDPITGTFVGLQTVGDVAPHDLLNGAVALAVTPDAADVLVVASHDHSITRFGRRTGEPVPLVPSITTTYQLTSNVDFGLLPPGEIMGRIVSDLDRDGLVDVGDLGFAGATIYVDLNENGQLDPDEPSAVSSADDPATADTDESGTYLISEVVQGDYAVRVVPPIGWTLTNPTTRVGGTGLLTPDELWRDGFGGTNYLNEPAGVTESPDGNFVYVASYLDNSVTVFARDQETGGLGLVQEVVTQGLLGAQTIAIPEDGQHLYVASARDDALVSFERDNVTGRLTYVAHLKDGIDGVDGLDEAVGISASRDGKFLYVAAATDGSIATFERDTATGRLTFLQKITGYTLGAFSVEVSPDDRHVYVSAFDSSAVTVYDRDGASGLLTRRQAVVNDSGGFSGLGQASGISLSPDGEHLYVAGYGSHGVAVLDRDAMSGDLSFVQFVADPFTETTPRPISVLVSPDGRHVAAMFEAADAVALYSRDAATGQLTLLQTLRDSDVNGLDGAWEAEFSRDGNSFYVVGAYDDAVRVLDRDAGDRVPTARQVSVRGGETLTIVGFAAHNDIPIVESLEYSAVSPVTSSTLDVSVRFSEPVENVDITDFSLSGTMTAATITGVVGSGDFYTVTIALGEAQGTLAFRLLDDDTIVDGQGQPLGGVGVDNGQASLPAIEVDRLAPTVASITTSEPNPTAAYLVVYTVDFNEPVSGVLQSHFSVVGTGTDPAVTKLQASSTPGRYFVTIHAGTTNGEVALKFNDDDTVADAAGHPVGGPGAGNGDAASEFLVIDRDVDLSGTVWHDRNGDSIRDADEPGIAGVTVYLDADDSGSFDSATELFTVSTADDPDTAEIDETGQYAFVGIAAGPKTIRVLHDDLDLQQTQPASGRYFYDAQHGDNTHLGYDGKKSLISSDDRFLYVADSGDHTLNVYTIAEDGLGIELIQLLRGQVDGIGGLGDPRAIALSPDGFQLYTTGFDHDELGVFQRDPATGLLTFAQRLVNGVDGVGGLNDPTMLAVSPDGRFVYTGGSNLATFKRSADTGLLTYVDSISGPRDGRQPLVSGDGAFLYVPSFYSDSVQIYQLDADTGLPTLIDTIGGLPDSRELLDGVASLAMSSDGEFVYAVARNDNALTVFDRDPTTGLLSELEVHQESYHFAIGLALPNVVRLSADGDTLFVTGDYDVTLSLFHVDPVSGSVVPLETTGRDDYLHLTGGSDIAVTSTGKHLFVPAANDPHIHLFGASAGTRVADPYEQGTIPGGNYYDLDFAFADLPPSVVKIEPAGRSRESLATAAFTVTFTEPVTGVDSSDFVIDAAGLTGTSVVSVSGSGTTYTVSVETGTGEGTLTLRLQDDDTIVDASGEPLAGAGPMDRYGYPSTPLTIDRTSPTVRSVTRVYTEKVTYANVAYTVRFDEWYMANVDVGDFVIEAPGLPDAVITGVDSGSTTYRVNVSTGPGTGEIYLRLRPDHDITDLAGNPLAADGFVTADPLEDHYLIERSATVTISGVKYEDSNGNGAQDASEPGLAGWTIFLDDNRNGRLDTGERSQVTASDGSYSFADLYSGTYDVAEIFQEGWQQTAPGRGDRRVERVSVDHEGNDANMGGAVPSVSGDGRYVAFESWSTDLTAGGASSRDVFVRDMATGQTQLVSATYSGVGANGNSANPVISDDGRFVVFHSSASNLVVGDNNGSDDIFVRDLAAGTTELVSVSSEGVQGDNGALTVSDISGDGRYVAFASRATNLVTGDTNAAADIFLRDRQSTTTELVSISYYEALSNGASGAPTVSDDGRYVAFQSVATNLVYGYSHVGSQVLVRDRQAGTTTYVSGPKTTTTGNASAYAPKISADGKYIAYWSDATNLVSNDDNGNPDVFVYRAANGHQERVSNTPAGTAGNGASAAPPDISSDGRFVAFISSASDLVAEDTNVLRDVFVRDRTEGVTRVLSTTAQGLPADRGSFQVAISSDGNRVVFDSDATQLVLGDYNQSRDVFVVDRTEDFAAYRHTVRAGVHQTLTLSFGSWHPTGTIAGIVWQDSNRDGQHDSGEPAIAGREVFLDANGNQTLDSGELSTTSDAQGRYEFRNLPAGSYEPVDVLPSDWESHSSQSGAGGPVTLGAQQSMTIDFEDLTAGSSIGYYQHGIFTLGTDAISGPHWNVYGAEDRAVATDRSTYNGFLTRADGEPFSIRSVDVGRIANATGSITFFGERLFGDAAVQTITVGVLASHQLAGFDGIHTLRWKTSSAADDYLLDDFDVSYDQWSDTGNDLGSMIQAGSINGILWHDANRDGVLDANEDRLERRFVFQDLNLNGSRELSEPITYTGLDGDYAFSSVEPGEYRLVPERPSGWEHTVPSEPVTVTVGAGETVLQNYGFAPPPTLISGTIWLDDDRDGIRSPEEPGVSDVTVFVDMNRNGILDADEPFQTTAADESATTEVNETGRYAFEDLPHAVYEVRQVLPPGWGQTAPAGVVPAYADYYDTAFSYAQFQHHPAEDLRISADGRFLVFSTFSPLVSEDNNDVHDVYLVDRSTGAIELVSVADSGANGNGASVEPDLSADGRFVVFRSGATNFSTADGSTSHDLYIRDRQLGTTTLASTNLDGASAGGHTADAILSPDGKRLLFFSYSSTLVSGDTNGTVDTFMKDLETGFTQRISLTESGAQSTGNSWGGDMSADGRYVVFTSRADGLSGGDNNQYIDVFWLDRVTGEMQLATSAHDGTLGDGHSDKRSISDDGRYVVFDSNSMNLLPEPFPSSSREYHTYLKDMVSGELKRISVPQVPGIFSGDSRRPEISADGRWVVFESVASLVGHDLNQRTDIYLYDRLEDSLQLISVSRDGYAGNGHSNNAVLSADGSTLAFTTTATDLVDLNEPGMIVVVELDSSLSAAAPHVVNLAATPVMEGADFGRAYVGATVAGRQFEDANENGTFDGDETPIPGATVFVDLNENGLLDVDEPQAVSAADGTYTLSDVPPGEQIVRSISPANFRASGGVASSNRLFAARAVSNAASASNYYLRVVELNPLSGAILWQRDTEVEVSFASSLAFDGERLLLTNGHHGSIDEFTPQGELVDRTPLPAPSGAARVGLGPVVVGGQVYVLTQGSGGWPDVRKFDPTTNLFSDLKLLSHPIEGYPDGRVDPNFHPAVGESADGSSIVLSTADDRLLKLDPATGKIVSSWVQGPHLDFVDYASTGFGGELFVAYGGGPGIQVYDEQHNVLRAIGGLPFLFGLGGGLHRDTGVQVSVAPLGEAIGVNHGHISTLSSLAGTIFNDLDGDGVGDPDEPPRAGATVYLDSNRNGRFDPDEPSVMTDASGTYTFAGLVADDYTVRAVVEQGHRVRALAEDATRLFTAGVVNDQIIISEIDPNSGETLSQFAPDVPSTLAVGLALDGDRLYLASSGGLWVFEASTGTRLDYTSLPAGGYDGVAILDGLIYLQRYTDDTIVAVDPSGMSLVKDFQVLDANQQPYDLIGAMGESADRSKLVVHAVADTVLVDPITESVLGSLASPRIRGGAAGAGGELFQGGGGINVIAESLEPAGQTLGTRTLRSLSTAVFAYAVAADHAPALAHRVTVTPGSTVTSLDFSDHLPPSSIAGLLWNDIDIDGVADADEQRLAARTVFLDQNANGTLDPDEPVATTRSDDSGTPEDETGRYEFRNLTAGEYSVSQVLPVGWIQTSPGRAEFEVSLAVLNGYSDGSNDGVYPRYDSSASGQGRFLAFSTSKPLLPEDTNNQIDIYVMDRQTGSTELASLAKDGTGAASLSVNPSISADGRFVTFQSLASNLVADDLNNTWDIFVRDRQQGTTVLASAVDPSLASGSSTGNSYSYKPELSGDGRYLLFWSNSSNLVAGDTNQQFDLFQRDLQLNTTERLNFAPDGGEASGGNTHHGEMTHGGRYVVYQSWATNLVAGDTNGASDVFVLDRQTGTTELVSRNALGAQGNAGSFNGSISDDGRYVAFSSNAANLSDVPGVQFQQIYLKDRQTGHVTLISRGINGSVPDGASKRPSISGDGRWVVFHSDASNLVSSDTNGAKDAFLYDTTTGNLQLLSRSELGAASNGSSEWVRISRDGSTITFQSSASDLVSPAATEGGLYVTSTLPSDGMQSPLLVSLQEGQSDWNANFGSRPSFDELPPEVTDVFVNHPLDSDSGGWGNDFRDFADGGFDDPAARGYRVPNQVDTLPWINITEISLQFSEQMRVSASQFTIAATPGGNPDFSTAPVPVIVGFDYDAASFLATLRLDGDPAVPGIQPLMPSVIDVEVADSATDQAGNPLKGGAFVYRLNFLPGDASPLQNQAVLGSDVIYTRNHQQEYVFKGYGASAGYDVRADVNGDGVILGSDVIAVRDRQNSFITAPTVQNTSSPMLGSEAEGGRTTPESERERTSGSTELRDAALLSFVAETAEIRRSGGESDIIGRTEKPQLADRYSKAVDAMLSTEVASSQRNVFGTL